MEQTVQSLETSTYETRIFGLALSVGNFFHYSSFYYNKHSFHQSNFYFNILFVNLLSEPFAVNHWSVGFCLLIFCLRFCPACIIVALVKDMKVGTQKRSLCE